MSTILKTGAVQMAVSAGMEENYRKIASSIRAAARRKLDLVAFPECALTGYGPLDYDVPEEIDLKKAARLTADLKKLVRQKGVAVIFGTTTPVKRNIYNTALFLDRTGRKKGEYHKMHLMPGDKAFYQPGNTLPLYRYNRIPVGIQICFDFRFPEPWRILTQKGAKVIVHIANGCKGAAWKVPVWEAHLRSRAAENGLFVVSANAAGPKQMGVSRIVDPNGLDLARAGLDKEEMICADLEIDKAAHAFYKQRRKDIYG